MSGDGGAKAPVVTNRLSKRSFRDGGLPCSDRAEHELMRYTVPAMAASTRQLHPVAGQGASAGWLDWLGCAIAGSGMAVILAWPRR